MAEMPESRPEDSGRKPRKYGKGASSGTARREPVRPEDLQLMEAVVARENMLDAYSRVMSNKGAAGVDKMPVEELKPYLQEHGARIRQELLTGTYQPQAVRWVEIPKPNGGVRQLGLIRRYLQAGMMTGGGTNPRTEGTPLGGTALAAAVKYSTGRTG